MFPLLQKGQNTILKLSTEANVKINQVPTDGSCRVLQANFKMYCYLKYQGVFLEYFTEALSSLLKKYKPNEQTTKESPRLSKVGGSCFFLNWL